MPETLPFTIGKGILMQEGSDVTIIATGHLVAYAMEAVKKLNEEGISAELINIHTIKPLDTDTVLGSVARTGRLLVVGEAWPWGGVTAEVIARIASEGFGLLDAPPMRLNAKDTPVPFHPNLWGTHRPTAKTISAAMRDLLRR